MSGADEIDRKALDAGYVCVGALRGAHGVKGLMKVASFTEHPASLFEFPDLYMGRDFKPVKVTSRSMAGDLFLSSVQGVSTREAAQALKGERLFVPRSALGSDSQGDSEDGGEDGGEDDFFHADLIGLEAVNPDGSRVGFVRSVEDFGAGDLLELALDEPVKGLGRIVFIPFTRALVPDVDIKGQAITIDMATWMQDQTAVPPKPEPDPESESGSGAKSQPEDGS